MLDSDSRPVGLIDVQDVLAQIISYSPMLRFVLIDKERRIFVTQRYCFLGSIDDWIVDEAMHLQSLEED